MMAVYFVVSVVLRIFNIHQQLTFDFMFKKLLSAALCLFFSFALSAQTNPTKKYPSLFWEITGNGLKKPSYLFGTMHVSNKLAFHLSDSFYHAIKSVDAVALELNPDLWQGQMVAMEALKQNYTDYTQPAGNDYLTENSFRINKYEDELKLALSTEASVVNSLLYRTYKAREDFEEDTFLDLYIFQTGRKLGKRAAGVEDYYETEKLVLQAYADMATEKKKKNIDTDGESMRSINQKIQDAYKRGDLDLMDSLDIMVEQSAAFREKFLYRRNEIQAISMDSIMKKSSLFVGVGAAHLPGSRGVIELLRKAGYILRPIKMADRDATQKEAVDKLKVPVQFNTVQSEDGLYKVDMPGSLYKVNEDYSRVNRSQFADMNNGSAYQVARVKTHGAFINQNEALVKAKIDSLLYENIPGKIIKKNTIEKNGYTGYDITNKTRRGDLQRYNIFITPFEVLIFKMSGKENYIDGEEAEHFFSSIQLKEANNNSVVFSPKQGGFSVKLPQQPSEYLNTKTSDNINRWEYEAVDKTTGDAYSIFKKSVYNFKFLEEDSFDLKMVEESFRSPDYFERQLQRKPGIYKGYACLDVKEKMKDSSIINARYLIKGPHYYVVAVRSKNPKFNANDFFNSFSFTPYQYNNSVSFTDSFLHFSVITPMAPKLDTSYRAALEKATEDVANNGKNNYAAYWPKRKNALFISDSTGELINVSVQKLPVYYYVKDSANYWPKQLEESYNKKDLVLYSNQYFEKPGGIQGYHFTLRDTGSSRTIIRTIILKDDHLFNTTTIGDTLDQQNSFETDFTGNFSPEKKSLGRNVFINNLDSLFSNLFSTDSATQAKAQQFIDKVYFGEKGVPKIMAALAKLPASDKNYFDIKTKLIAELGYIKDSTKPLVVDNLLKLYKQTTDTSMFQNEIIEALARHNTTAAVTAFKELVLLDPPVYDDTYSYKALFNTLDDSLKLAATLYPELLQLSSVDDYKEPVISLLAKLVDSGYVKAPQYKSWFSKIYFDARIELKKQQAKDERKAASDKKKKNDDDELSTVYSTSNRYSSALDKYAVLLAPFYDTDSTVPNFFNKLLRSNDDQLRLNALIILLRNKQAVPDSIFTTLAASDLLRGKLFTVLEKNKRLDKFPAKYKTQLSLAKSYMVRDKGIAKIDSIVFLSKQPATYQHKKGMVYFFKYRVKKDDDWKIGISGLQPEKSSAVSSDDGLARMTDKKLKEAKPIGEQLQEQLNKLLFNFHNSSKYFYTNNNLNYRPLSDD